MGDVITAPAAVYEPDAVRNTGYAFAAIIAR